MNRDVPNIWHVIGRFSIGFGATKIWIKRDEGEFMTIKYENFEEWLKMIWDKEF